jgi:hypothetical protein
MASNKMPPELLEKFQKKNAETEAKGEDTKGMGDKETKAKRMEALRKARKAKAKK